MYRRYSFFIIAFFFIFTVTKAQDKLTITPAFPERGQAITITYDPAMQGAVIADTAAQVDMVFSYSNLYGIANKIKLDKKEGKWTTSFVLPHYATYATFYLQSGSVKDQPAADKHFAIAVYNKKKRVRDGYLYEGYSLPAQTGKVPDLALRQSVLYEEELKQYPANYEAKLRLLVYKMAKADAKDKETFRKQAQQIIAAKFNEKPGDMGLMNKTTMGYLIIGENSRLDSVREVVKKKYPATEAGYELIIADISEQKDSAAMATQLLGLIKKASPANTKYLVDAHKILFEYYASQKETAKALYHLQKIGKDTTPYAAANYKQYATVLMRNNMALDTALSFAGKALALADVYPAGIIRYFPETGYIPSYISPDARTQATAKATGNILSLMGLIQMKKKSVAEAEALIDKAVAASTDAETLTNAGEFFETTGSYKKAFKVYKAIALQVPEDTTAFNKMKTNFIGWNNNTAELNEEIDKVKASWRSTMLAQLKQEIISVKAPDFIAALVDMKGNTLSPDFIKNKIVVIDFWATWCVPCMQEMPYLQNVYTQYKSDTSVVFMVINSGSKNTLQDAQNWIGNKRYDFPVYYTNDRGIGDSFKFNVIPATYVIDKAGNIRFKNIGFEGAVIERKIAASIDLLK